MSALQNRHNACQHAIAKDTTNKIPTIRNRLFMKTTLTKIRLQLLALTRNKKGRRGGCVQLQAVFNETKLKAQLFQIRPDLFTQNRPPCCNIGLVITSLIIAYTFITRVQNTIPIDIKLHNRHILYSKKCG